MGRDGIGLYPYTDGKAGWYKPSENCKMQYLGKEYEFCDVCKEAIREAVCEQSSPEAVQKLLMNREGEDAGGALVGEGDSGDSPGQESLVGAFGRDSVTGGPGAKPGHGADLPAERVPEDGSRSSGAEQSVPGETVFADPSEDDVSMSTAAAIFMVSAALLVVANWQGKGRRRRR